MIHYNNTNFGGNLLNCDEYNENKIILINYYFNKNYKAIKNDYLFIIYIMKI